MRSYTLKFILSILIGLCASTLLGQGFRQGELAISPGIGTINFLTTYSSTPIVVNAEYGLTNMISGGGFIGVRLLNAPGLNPAFHTALGARLSAHLFPILNRYADTAIDDSKMDVYITLMTGYEFGGSTYNIPRPFIYPRPVLGGRYYLADPIAIWVEVGLGAFSLANAGVTIRLDR